MKIIQLFIYLLSTLRFKLYEKKILKNYSFNIPVLSVGNISMGGTGKTPMVNWLVQYLISIDKKPCVITRGYGRLEKKTLLVNPNNKQSYSINDLGDEPFALWKKNPGISMVVSSNKIKAINLATKEMNCDVIVLDDGFQSLYIKRNLDIVMINARETGSLMREKVSSLSRADVIVFKEIGDDDDFASQIFSIANLQDTLKLATKNCFAFDLSLDARGPFLGVCGIANPNSFKDSLNKNNITVNEFLKFNDHYHYSDLDMKYLYKKMQDNGCRAIITTTKDYYKLEQINIYNIKIIAFDLSFDFIDNRANYNNQLDFKNLIKRKI